jgi:hypothetical protein
MTSAPPGGGLDGFKAELRDALVDVLRERPAARRAGWVRARRVAALAVTAILVVGGTVAAAQVLTRPDKLAAGEIACYDDPAMAGGVDGATYALAGQQGPLAACAEVLARNGRPVPPSLIACVPAGGARVAVIPGRAGDCERHGLEPLPIGYDPEREKVARLERDLRAIERSADCVPPKELARRVQAVLDRSGWTGWTTTVVADAAGGPCGHVLAPAEPDGRRILGELDVDGRRLSVWGEPPPSTMDLLRRLSPALAEESGERCFTVDQLRAHVRQRVAPTGRRVTFNLIRDAAPGQAIPGARGARLAAGCAIVEKVGADHNGRDLIALIHVRR